MSPHAYTEDQLVEQPAIGLFSALGWQTVSAMEETFGPGGTLGRETKGEVVLIERLRAALITLNSSSPPEAVQSAIDELVRNRSAMNLEAANRELHILITQGFRSRSPTLPTAARPTSVYGSSTGSIQSPTTFCL